MSRYRETNPHFQSQSQPPPQHQTQHPQPQHSPNLQLPAHQQPRHQDHTWSEHDPNIHFPLHEHAQYPHEQTRPQHDPNLHFPVNQQPHRKKKKSQAPPDPSRQKPQHQRQHTQPHPVPSPQHSNQHTQPHPVPSPQHSNQHTQPHPVPRPHHSNDQRAQPHPVPQPHHSQNESSLRFRHPRKTKPLQWFIAVFCALFWIIIILGGLAILIVYLLFRPRSPKFDVSSASLNAAYLDMGYLLNADLTLLANFSNPNKKVRVDFSYMVINLYYERALIATRYVEHFTVRDKGSKFADIHLVSSQVPLSIQRSQQLKMNMENNSVTFEVRGLFRTQSSLGNFLRYKYWLYGHCTIVLTGPPGGVMVAKKCRTKR